MGRYWGQIVTLIQLAPTHLLHLASASTPKKIDNKSHYEQSFSVIYSVIIKYLSKMTYNHSQLKLFDLFFIVISDNVLVFKKILFNSFSVQYGRSPKVMGIMGWKYIMIILGYRRHNRHLVSLN